MQGLSQKKTTACPFLFPLIRSFTPLLVLLSIMVGLTLTGNNAYAASAAPTATIVSHSVTGSQIPVGQKGSVTASCQSGEQLLSGGYNIDAFETANVIESYPSAPNSWTVTDDNTAAPSWVEIIVTVYCLQSSTSGTPKLVHTVGTGTVTAQCPAYTTLTGGGFKGTGVTASLPFSSGWQVTGTTIHDTYAVCARTHLAPAPAVSTSFTVPAVFDALGGGTANCGTGQLATGGGFNSDGSTSFPIKTSVETSTTGWGLAVYGSGYYTTKGTVWAVCVTPQ